MLSKPRLVTPSVKYRESFLDALQEYDTLGQKPTLGMDAELIRQDFNGYIKYLHQTAKKDVTHPEPIRTVYWLVDNGEYIGRVVIKLKLPPERTVEVGQIGYSVRPGRRSLGYGTKALELALLKAKNVHGLVKVIITCSASNSPSLRIIQKNGGVLAKTIDQGENLPQKQVFEIDLT